MTLFDGRVFAKEIEERVRQRVAELSDKPKIVSVLVGNDPASELYTRLKREMAERVGVQFEVNKLTSQPASELVGIIKQIGEREEVTGIMVQMPIPGLSREEQQEVVKAIPLEKDVDGLRWEESGVMPATVKAILSILEKIALDSQCQIFAYRFVVVGSHGSVGRPLVHFLQAKGVKDILEVNSQTQDPAEVVKQGQVVISCVGKPGVVTADMIGQGVIAVDAGISQVEGKTVGDMTSEVYNAAAVAVPVPGGVGPVTVASLLSNAVTNL